MLIKKRCNKRGDLNNSGEPFDSLLIPNEGILHYGNRYIIKGSATGAKSNRASLGADISLISK